MRSSCKDELISLGLSIAPTFSHPSILRRAEVMHLLYLVVSSSAGE
jgi:hypothetical protein